MLPLGGQLLPGVRGGSRRPVTGGNSGRVALGLFAGLSGHSDLLGWEGPQGKPGMRWLPGPAQPHCLCGASF